MRCFLLLVPAALLVHVATSTGLPQPAVTVVLASKAETTDSSCCMTVEAPTCTSASTGDMLVATVLSYSEHFWQPAPALLDCCPF
jgi:hypothetical protein